MPTIRIVSRLLSISTIFLLTPSSTAYATTIVVARTPTEIVIGADSRVTDTYGNSLNNRVCKIQQAGNLFIALEGLLRDKKTGFNVAELAKRALQQKSNAAAAERVSILTGALTSALFVELVQVRRHSPDVFQRKIEGQTFLRIVIAGFEKNRPVVFVRQFRMAFIAGKIGVTVIPDDCLDDCKGEVVTRFLGETAAIEGLPEETPGFWKDGLVTGVRSLIETEIAARSEHVGAPIDLLQIKASGAKWIQKKAECPALQPLGKPVNPATRRRRR